LCEAIKDALNFLQRVSPSRMGIDHNACPFDTLVGLQRVCSSYSRSQPRG
jgi:hypothetical protein